MKYTAICIKEEVIAGGGSVEMREVILGEIVVPLP